MNSTIRPEIILSDEKGVILPLTVIFLLLLTVLGIFATTTSTIEMQIAGNEKRNRMVFYAADSGVHYVAVNPDLYGIDNATNGSSLPFPDPAVIPAGVFPITNSLSISGRVDFINTSQLPPGTGFTAGTVIAVNYELDCDAAGLSRSAATVQAGFFRIGLGTAF